METEKSQIKTTVKTKQGIWLKLFIIISAVGAISSIALAGFVAVNQPPLNPVSIGGQQVIDDTITVSGTCTYSCSGGNTIIQGCVLIRGGAGAGCNPIGGCTLTSSDCSISYNPRN